ncbi:MAG: DNA-protecting protein DprA [Candidatus Nanogingivalaceae bacterium]|nr:DNA-protecting protein DprA [Candidatus Nanogingivalaceae bacterium]
MEIFQINLSDYNYLRDLPHIPDPPKKLFIRGKLPAKRVKTVAIVGTRKPSAYGREIATKIASECAKNGIVVVSGLALGIDSIAHRAAIDSGGKTIAVLANGVDKIYPRSHEDLGQKILQTNGAILSEYPNNTPARPWQFLARNRIVSGLADAVVIIEAASRSGTLSTANHALDQGKEIFAVPGNITSPLSAGCNQLIKNGANPLTSVEDLLDFLIPDRFEKQTQLFKGDTREENVILEFLSKNGTTSSDSIIKQTKLSASEFNQAITMLELEGLVLNNGGEKWSLK